MLETGKSNPVYQHTLSIRLSAGGFSFSAYTPSVEGACFQLVECPMGQHGYGVTEFAEAMQRIPMLREQRFSRIVVVVSGDVIHLPREGFFPEEAEHIYRHSFPESEQATILYNVLGGLDMIELFSLDSALYGLLLERFPTARYYSTATCVLEHLQRRSRVGEHRKLYALFHDDRLSLFHFEQGLLRFANTFPVASSEDASYFVLSVWQTLQLNQEKDELHLLGSFSYKEELLTQLNSYLQKVCSISVSAEFNRAPLSLEEGIPYDLLTLLQTLR